MSKMWERAAKVLEFDKIKERLEGLAVCPAARERIASLTPHTALPAARAAQDETTQAAGIIARRGLPPLTALYDAGFPLRRAKSGAPLSTGELLNLGRVMRTARLLKRYFDEKNFADNYPALSGIFAALVPLREPEEKIFTAIIGEGEIADDASPELARLRRQAGALEGRVKEVLEGIIHSARYQKILQEPIITLRNERYVIPVKAEHKSEIRGIVHGSSATGATLFVEPMQSLEINNKIKALKALEQAEIERILAALSALCADNAPAIEANYHAALALDEIFARARLSAQMNAAPPELNDVGEVSLKKARHPLLDPKTAVPIDINIGINFNTLVITGPNTGGKTVTLKTLGLLTLMAQSGLHLPAAQGSRVAVFGGVFADIGDEQSIEQSLSTFSSHMVNIVEILKKAGSGALVLLDELGAGTDPTEGAAIAISILEGLRGRGVITAATTHYSEIKLYALSTEGVENAACEFDIISLRPTYRLLIGVPGKSNAFAISERLGLGADIINRAREFISAPDVRFEDVIAKLEEGRKKAEEDSEKAERYLSEARERRLAAEAEEKRQEEAKAKIISEAQREAKRILEGAKRTVSRLINETERAAREKAQSERGRLFSEIRREMSEGLGELDKSMSALHSESRGHVPPKNLKEGNTVEIISLRQRGTVLTKPDKAGNVQIQTGILKVWANIKDLSLVADGGGKAAAQSILAARVQSGQRAAAMEIDVRGQTLDEAQINVDKFLDDAALSALESVTIIHGKGTGALRAGLQKHLKSQPHVKSFRSGRYGEGEMGVTVVELK